MKNGIIVLILYMALFSAIFILSLINYYSNTAIISIGLSARITNILLMMLSFLGIGKTAWHIVRY